METEKFRQLIYAKGFDVNFTHKLLKIADSSMVMEDMLDFIKDLIDNPEESGFDVCEPDSCYRLKEAEDLFAKNWWRLIP